MPEFNSDSGVAACVRTLESLGVDASRTYPGRLGFCNNHRQEMSSNIHRILAKQLEQHPGVVFR